VVRLPEDFQVAFFGVGCVRLGMIADRRRVSGSQK